MLKIVYADFRGQAYPEHLDRGVRMTKVVEWYMLAGSPAARGLARPTGAPHGVNHKPRSPPPVDAAGLSHPGESVRRRRGNAEGVRGGTWGEAGV